MYFTTLFKVCLWSVYYIFHWSVHLWDVLHHLSCALQNNLSQVFWKDFLSSHEFLPSIWWIRNMLLGFYFYKVFIQTPWCLTKLLVTPFLSQGSPLVPIESDCFGLFMKSCLIYYGWFHLFVRPFRIDLWLFGYQRFLPGPYPVLFGVSFLWRKGFGGHFSIPWSYFFVVTRILQVSSLCPIYLKVYILKM